IILVALAQQRDRAPARSVWRQTQSIVYRSKQGRGVGLTGAILIAEKLFDLRLCHGESNAVVQGCKTFKARIESWGRGDIKASVIPKFQPYSITDGRVKLLDEATDGR